MLRRRMMGKTKCTLTVYTTAFAQVVINGTTIQANSSGYAYFQLKKGTYSFSASKSGYTSRAGSVVLTGNQTLSIVLSATPIDTIFLMHCNGNLTDEYGHKATASGVTRYVSGKFGQALNLDGSWHVHLDNAGFGSIIRDESWTLEYWLYPILNNLSNKYIVCSWYQGQWAFVTSAGPNGIAPHMEVRDAEDVRAYGGTCNYSWNLNQWNHIAFVKHGMTYTVYCNGRGTDYPITYNRGREVPYFDIGYKADTGRNEGGFYIDEIRISKGARYTSNFTPPSSQFSS